MLQILITLWQNKHFIMMLNFAKKHPKKAGAVILIAWLLSSGIISNVAILQAIEILDKLNG